MVSGTVFGRIRVLMPKQQDLGRFSIYVGLFMAVTAILLPAVFPEISLWFASASWVVAVVFMDYSIWAHGLPHKHWGWRLLAVFAFSLIWLGVGAFGAYTQYIKYHTSSQDTDEVKAGHYYDQGKVFRDAGDLTNSAGRFEESYVLFFRLALRNPRYWSSASELTAKLQGIYHTQNRMDDAKRAADAQKAIDESFPGQPASIDQLSPSMNPAKDLYAKLAALKLAAPTSTSASASLSASTAGADSATPQPQAATNTYATLIPSTWLTTTGGVTSSDGNVYLHVESIMLDGKGIPWLVSVLLTVETPDPNGDRWIGQIFPTYQQVAEIAGKRYSVRVIQCESNRVQMSVHSLP